MFMGVPYVPFFIGAGSVILLSFYTNMFFLALLPVVIFVMRQMARRDEMIFRLLGLRLQVRRRVRNLDRHDGMWAFSPNAYRDPRAKYPVR
jgi:type IV secretion system protein VirB3